MKKFIELLALSLLLLLSACAAPPTQQELAAADYGGPVTHEEAVRVSSGLLKTHLRDFDSARIEWAPVQQGWIRESIAMGGQTRYGYVLKAAVNAKNAFGGYVGYRPYQFLFRDGYLVAAYTETLTSGGVGVMQRIR